MSSRSITLTVGDERLITARGTIIPQSLRFADGSMLLSYHLGFDAWWTAMGMSRSDDGGVTWQDGAAPPHQVAALGLLGPRSAIFLDTHLVRRRGDEYSLLYSRSDDAGRTMGPVREATVTIPNLIAKPYVPQTDSPFFPPMPDWYRQRWGDDPHFAGSMFGRVIRLRDGSLATVCYGCEVGNLPKRRKQGADASQGIAEQANAGESNSAILLRSTDEGESWRAVSTCGRLEPGRPFDGGYFYSEGFNETALAELADGELLVIMRHGSYHLLWTNRSRDGGQSWSGLQMLNHPGVAPNAVMLDSGILAASWGRPGLTVAFSTDGTGRLWDATTELMRGDEASQRYPWLQPIDARTLWCFYDRRTWAKPHARYVNHGIYARVITVRVE
jgi:hypothetical protein